MQLQNLLKGGCFYILNLQELLSGLIGYFDNLECCFNGVMNVDYFVFFVDLMNLIFNLCLYFILK